MESRTSSQPVGQGGSHGPFWLTPTKYGAAEAVMSMGTIAAPLLAGFSLAAFVLVLALSANDVRYGDVAALLFLLAAVFLVLAVQATFWARENLVTPDQLKEWWPDADEPYRVKQLKDEQAEHAAGFKTWGWRARTAYDLGLLCLLAGLTVLAIPPASANPPARWVAVGVGAIAFALESIWVVASFRA
jgi:hypothetical protein